MPLAVRYVEPKHLYRQPLPRGIRNELQAVAAFSLCGVIRQLGSLAKHAESLMGELCEAMKDCAERGKTLEERVEHLKRKVIPRLDLDSEAEYNMEVILDVDHYQSKHHVSQQLLHIETAPDSLIEQYRSSQEKPALHLFAPHTKNNPMHLYSQPEFFFNHWRSEMERKAVSSTNRRRNASNSEPILEESVEVSQIVPRPPPPTAHTTKMRGRSKSTRAAPPPMSYSSTLPLRMKPRRGNKTKQEMLEVFASVKKQKGKERGSITAETFTPMTNGEKVPTCNGEVHPGVKAKGGDKGSGMGGANNNSQDHSESSGYMSQHSSSSTSLVEAEHGEESKLGVPRVLNRTKSSSSLTRKGNSPKRGVAPSTSKEGGDGSPRRVASSGSPMRKGSGQVGAVPFISPNASPEIVHKTVNLVRSLSQTSPVHEGAWKGEGLRQASSGIFNFPDPIQFLISNQHMNRPSTSFSLEDILSIDDDGSGAPPTAPPTDLAIPSSTVPPKNGLSFRPTDSPGSYKSFSSNESPKNRVLRPAPSPPVGATPTRRHHSMSNGYSPKRKGSGDVVSRDSSVEASPTFPRKASLTNASPTPKRKAPPPPFSVTTPTHSPKLIGKVRSYTQIEGGASPKMQRKISHEILRNDSPSSPKKTSPTNFVWQKDGLHGNRRNSEKKILQQKVGNASPPMATRKEHETAAKERRHSNSVTTPPAGPQSPVTPKPEGAGNHGNKLKGLCIKRQSSGDKFGKKSTNQILRASGVETVLTAERTNLLTSIRKGIQLKKVQQKELEENIPSDLIMPWDVAAILERRKALENSDNELDDGLVQDAEWEEL